MKLENLKQLSEKPIKAPDGLSYFFADRVEALEQRLAYAKELFIHRRAELWRDAKDDTKEYESINAFIEKLNGEGL